MSIANSGHDERGKYTGGKAGDQTGSEWEIRSWYNRPWDCVLRYPDAKVREKIAEWATRAAKNDHIGYDQNDRYTFWDHLVTSNYDPAQITVDCESDCSAGVLAIVKAVGFVMNIQALKNVSIYGYTGNMKSILTQAGFEVLTASKYLTGDSYLYAGDILLNIKSHTAINITTGSKAGGDTPTPTPTPSEKGEYSRTNIVPYENSKTVQEMQACLAVLGFYDADLGIDGIYGGGTFKSICDFQEKYDLGADGYASVTGITWKKIDELMEGKHATIEPGFTGKAVYEMQAAMNLFGYRANGIGGDYLEEDGDYGTKTKNAVCQLQSDYNLGPDGLASSTGVTWKKVDELYNSIHEVIVTSQNGLNVRKGRGTDTAIVQTIGYNTTHKATNNVNGWTYLHDCGGWVINDWIK